MNKIKQDTCHDNIIWILTVEMFLLVRQSGKSYDECTQFFSSPAVMGSRLLRDAQSWEPATDTQYTRTARPNFTQT